MLDTGCSCCCCCGCCLCEREREREGRRSSTIVLTAAALRCSQQTNRVTRPQQNRRAHNNANWRDLGGWAVQVAKAKIRQQKSTTTIRQQSAQAAATVMTIDNNYNQKSSATCKMKASTQDTARTRTSDQSTTRPRTIITFRAGCRAPELDSSNSSERNDSGCHNIVILMCWPQRWCGVGRGLSREPVWQQWS